MIDITEFKPMISTIQWLLLLLDQESRCQLVFDIGENLTSNLLFKQKKKKKKINGAN